MTEGRRRLEGWFAEGRLLRPHEPGVPTSVDVARVLFSLVGASDLSLSTEAERLRDVVGSAERYVLVLIDGLGMELLGRCPASGFLRSQPVTETRAVFPSTTAAALTSLATAEYPARHAVTGWWIYLADRDLTATALPFQERFSGRDLAELGISPDEIFPMPTVLPRIRHSPLTITPAVHARGIYSRYSTGGTAVLGYAEIAEAFQLVLERLSSHGGPSYTVLYLPHVDDLAHGRGLDSQEVAAALAAFDGGIARLRDELAADVRIVVTGDHGHTHLDSERALVMAENDPILDRVRCPPTGEPTVPVFHLTDDRPDDFRALFRDRFGDAFALLSVEEVEQMELLGPGRLSPRTRARLGDLIGIAPCPTALYLQGAGEPAAPHRSVHAGLTPAEMRVPLIVA